MDLSSPIVAAVAVFVGVLALLVALFAATGGRQRGIRRRLDVHVVQVSADEARRLEKFNVLKAETYSAIPLVNAILARSGAAQTARTELRLADVSLTAFQYLFGRLVLAVVLAGAVWLAGEPLLAPIGVIAGLALPRVWLRFRARRRRKAFEAQLAEAIDHIVGALRAGHGFLQGLESVTRETEGPVRAEFVRLIEEVHVGVNPIDALNEMTERIDSYDLALFTSSVSIHRRVGGNLAEVLENIASTVRERRRIRAEVFALTTGPRVSSYVLCLLPIVVLVGLCMTNGDYRQTMLSSQEGHAMLGFAAIWSLIGLFLSQKVSKVEY